MLVAYCDCCDEEIDPEVAAGVRYVIGHRQLSGHLCEEHQARLLALVEELHSEHLLRVVR